MKTVVIYYSFGGATAAAARQLAEERGCPVFPAEEVRKRNLLTSFFPGCSQARKRRATEIKPLGCDLNDYDRILIGAPIWANFPAPAFNAILGLLPPGKEVELFFCSGGGQAEQSKAGTKQLIADKGCKLIDYRDIRTGKPPRAK